MGSRDGAPASTFASATPGALTAVLRDAAGTRAGASGVSGTPGSAGSAAGAKGKGLLPMRFRMAAMSGKLLLTGEASTVTMTVSTTFTAEAV